MTLHKLGKSNLEISSLGIGCWAIGDEYWGNSEEIDSIRAIQTGLDNGLNFLDTAEIYGDGKSEELVGKAIKGNRSKVILSSKVWETHMQYSSVFTACEDSLKRLGTDYLDIYFIHYPPDICTAEETMSAMIKLQQQGKIRVIGLSNFSVPQMEDILKVGRFDVIQPCHNLFWRFMEKDELPFCIKHDIGIVTYSPLAQGLLTGKYLKDRTLSPTDGRANSPLFLGENFIRCVEAADALKPIAKKYNKTTGQLAIAWALSIFGITSAIVGAKNANQMLQNIGGMGFVIESEDLIEIDKIGRTVTDYLPHYKSFFNSTIVE